jgi:hypothetical protein
MKWKGVLIVAAAAPLPAAEAQQLHFRLELDPAFFAEDACLAPAFEGTGCAQLSHAPGDSRPTASAALLAPDLADPAPLLAFDFEVLREGTEVTFSG